MEHIKVDLIPKYVRPICHASQYDNGRIIRFDITNDGADYVLQAEDVVTIFVRKLDGKLVTAAPTYTAGNSYVDLTTTTQMTAVVGENIGELRITNSTEMIGSINFVLKVEEDPTNGAISSDSELEGLQALIDADVAEAMEDVSLNDLGDVNISSPSSGQVLKYNSTSGKWVNGEGGSSVGDLDDLGDVEITNPTDEQILKYSASANKWVNGTGGSGGTTDYDDLNNKPQINAVTLSGNKTAEDLNLIWVGTQAEYDAIVNKNPATVYYITDSSSGWGDVAISTLYSGWDTFGANTELTLSDEVSNYDEIIIYAAYNENDSGSYYTHRGIIRIDRSSAIWSVAEQAESGNYRGWLDVIASFESPSVSASFCVKFPTTKKIKCTKKTVNTWQAGKIGIEKIIGVKYCGISGSGSSGGALSDLSDTHITNPSGGQVLKWSDSESKWINGSGGDANTWQGTQAQYDAITTKDPDTVYFITDTNGDGSKFQPVIYSETEREIGVWTDGKPLYEKTIYNAGGRNGLISIPHNISNLGNAVSISGTCTDNYSTPGNQYTFSRISNDGNNIGVATVSPTDIIIYIPSAFGQRVVDVYITIRYTKTTDTEGSGTWTPQGVPAVHYSTNEQVVGTWIDDSPVYEKTITTDFGSSSDKVIDLTTFNINSLIYVDGFIIASDSGNSIMIGYGNAGSLSFTTAKFDNITVHRGGSSAWGNNPEIYVTIRYTKSSS